MTTQRNYQNAETATEEQIFVHQTKEKLTIRKLARLKLANNQDLSTAGEWLMIKEDTTTTQPRFINEDQFDGGVSITEGGDNGTKKPKDMKVQATRQRHTGTSSTLTSTRRQYYFEGQMRRSKHPSGWFPPPLQQLA